MNQITGNSEILVHVVVLLNTCSSNCRNSFFLSCISIIVCRYIDYWFIYLVVEYDMPKIWWLGNVLLHLPNSNLNTVTLISLIHNFVIVFPIMLSKILTDCVNWVSYKDRTQFSSRLNTVLSAWCAHLLQSPELSSYHLYSASYQQSVIRIACCTNAITSVLMDVNYVSLSPCRRVTQFSLWLPLLQCV